MAATDAHRRANNAILHGHIDVAITAGLRNQPANTSRAYRKPQADFQVKELLFA
jgi:hypothetical protein